MKSFRYKHSIAVWVLLSIIVCACGAGCVLNVINAFNNTETIKIVGHAVIAVITLALFVLALSVVVSSKFYIKGGDLVLAFGFVKIRTPISEAVAITFIPFKKRLVVVFTDNRFLTIVINPELFDQFVNDLRAENNQIVYNIDNTGMDEQTDVQ